MKLKNLTKSLFAVAMGSLVLTGCGDCCKKKCTEEKVEITDAQVERYGITNKEYLSAATKRALKCVITSYSIHYTKLYDFCMVTIEQYKVYFVNIINNIMQSSVELSVNESYIC